MARSMWMVLVALALVACGDDDGDMTTTDSGVGVDAGTGGMDAGPRVDAGPSDPCATDDDPLATVGCNGFVTGDAPANQPGGTCTPGGESNPAGSCTTAQTLCDAAEGATTGECLALCTPAETYVASGCPTGFRCFTLDFDGEAVGICFRDCDETHPCGTGQVCDEEGSCVADEPPPSDAGTPDAGMSDAGMDDAGTPDAGTPEA